MSKNQVFRGKEIEAILGAAARLQEEEGADGAGSVGLSLEEIEAIAAESGINPEFVRRAALVRETGSPKDDGFHVFGGPAVLRRELVLNRKLSKTELERLVPLFRRITDNEGRADSLHDSLAWHTNDQRENRGTSVVLSTSGDQTVCSLRSTLWMPGFLIHYVPLILTLLISLPIGGAAAFSSTAIAIKLGVMGLVFLLTRYAYAAFAKKRAGQLDEIVSAIESAVQDPGADAGETKTNVHEDINEATSEGPVLLDDVRADDARQDNEDGRAQSSRRERS